MGFVLHFPWGWRKGGAEGWSNINTGSTCCRTILTFEGQAQVFQNWETKYSSDYWPDLLLSIRHRIQWPLLVWSETLRFLQRAGNAEGVYIWGIAAFCINLAALSVALVTRKLQTVSVGPAQPETFFSTLEKRSPRSATAGVRRSSGGCWVPRHETKNHQTPHSLRVWFWKSLLRL